MKRLKRSEREAFDAASAVFREAGWPHHQEFGGKHKLIVVELPDGSECRLPVAGSPSGGVHGAVNLSTWEARKLLRKHGVPVPIK